MNKVLAAVVSLLLFVAATTSVLAAKGDRLKFIEGDVVTIDVAAKAMTVRGRKAETVIAIDEKTTVKMNREKRSLSDIKIGDRVIVKYTEAEGKYSAVSVEIKPAKTDKKISETGKPVKPGH